MAPIFYVPGDGSKEAHPNGRCFIAAEMLCLSLSMCVSLSSPVDYSRGRDKIPLFEQRKSQEGHLLASFGVDSIQICLVLREEATKNRSGWRGEVVQWRARGA